MHITYVHPWTTVLACSHSTECGTRSYGAFLHKEAPDLKDEIPFLFPLKFFHYDLS